MDSSKEDGNLDKIYKLQLINSHLTQQMDYAHTCLDRDGRDTPEDRIANSPERVLDFHGMQLLVIPFEQYEPKKPSRFTVAVQGFLDDYHYKTDENGFRISKIESIPEILKDEVRKIIKENGLEGKIIFA